MKYTDEEIIKALEHCANGYRCKSCLFENPCQANVEFVAKQALDVIKRMDGEIEKLTRERDEARRDCAVAERNHLEQENKQ